MFLLQFFLCEEGLGTYEHVRLLDNMGFGSAAVAVMAITATATVTVSQVTVVTVPTPTRPLQQICKASPLLSGQHLDLHSQDQTSG